MDAENIRVVCSICGRSYGDSLNLKSHMRRSHSRGIVLQQLLDTRNAEEQTETSTRHINEAISSFEEETVSTPFREESELVGSNIEMNEKGDSTGLGCEELADDRLPLSVYQPDETNWNQVERDVSRNVIRFFETFADTSEILYPKLASLTPAFHDLNDSSKDLLGFCMKLQFTLGEAKSFFILIQSIEQRIPEGFRFVSSSFPGAEAFASYLDRLRKWKVRKEGWKTAIINTSFGINRTGVYRSALQLLFKTMSKAGGVSAIESFDENVKHEMRFFSNPCDSEGMGEYQKCHTLGGKLVGIDLYSDGTILANSGSQSANCVRVRFVNVKGQSAKWHDVGITPSVHEGDILNSEQEKRRERCQLFQRFLFLLLQDFISASHDGVVFQGEIIFPRLVMVVADQPQERAFFCLKGSDSYADCSLCLMPSRMKIDRDDGKSATAERKRLREDNSISNYSTFEIPTNTSTMRQKVFKIQTTPTGADERSVGKTVMAQIMLTDSRREKEHQLRLVPSYTSQLLKDLRQHLEEMSAIEFPPVLAAISGLGSKPFRLYKSIAFDKLHVIEHGLLREVTDEAYRAFEAAPAYHGLGKGEIVSIANQRILDAPRSAKLAKFAPFRTSAHEKHSGVSGKLRRELTPFLWYSIMGISRAVNPDEDPLLQVLLSVDSLQRKLYGVNQPLEESARSLEAIRDLQELCFQVGKQTSEVLELPVNTKVHRIMRHILDHFVSYGCIRKGATDDNETLHKVTKKGYSSTNHHLVSIAPQLLSARVRLGSTSNIDAEVQTTGALLLSRYAIVHDETPSRDTARADFRSECAPAYLRPVTEMSKLTSNLENGKTVEDTEANILRQVHPSMITAIWTKVKRVKFLASLPWMPNYKVMQMVYAGEKVYGSAKRNDGVIYKQCDRFEYGIVQSIWWHANHANSRILLVRRLKEVGAEPGNIKVVETHGNKRFAYFCNDQDVMLDAVGVESLIRAVVLVPDPYLVSRLFGRKQRMNNIPDNVAVRRKMRYFEVAGFKYTSFPEHKH